MRLYWFVWNVVGCLTHEPCATGGQTGSQRPRDEYIDDDVWVDAAGDDAD